jgi:hypothetical protein
VETNTEISSKTARGECTFSRRHGVTQEQLSELKERFPSWEFKFGDGPVHPHAIGACERAITEQILYQRICKKYGEDVRITDIGGNANRHLQAGRPNVHSCNPVLSAADAVRRHPDNYASGANYCSMTAGECTDNPDVYLSIHSLYYLTPKQVLEFIGRATKKRFYGVAHAFDKLYGHLHVVDGVPESTYEAFWNGKEMMVHMGVAGNHTGYTHPISSWLQETNYFEYGGEAMAWTSTPMGDSFLYEFVTAKTGLQPENTRPLSLCESLNRKDHYGAVEGMVAYGDQAELTPMMARLRITTGTTISFGSFCVTLSKKSTYALVPKDLIVNVGNQMVGLPRNEKTLTTCINKMRASVAKMNIPEHMKMYCLTYGSAYAFVYSLKDEVAAFNNLCKPAWQRAYNTAKNAMALGRLSFFSTTASMDERPSCFPWVCGMGSIAANEAACARRSVAETMRDAYAREYVTPASETPFETRDAWPDGLPGYESQMPLSQMKPGSRLKDGGQDDTREYPPQLKVNCPVFTPIQAVVPNPSKNNELRALVNRALVDTVKEDPALWKLVHMHAKTLSRQFDWITEEYDVLFKNWNAKFPDTQRRRNLEAYVNIRQRGLSPKDLVMKMFVKREVTLKTGDELEDFDPRAIQGCTDEMNVSYGPFIWACSKRLCLEWNLENRICYTSGLTAEQVGLWRADFEGQDELTIIELDESRYDAHQGRGAYGCSAVLKHACGIRNYELPREVEARCYEKHGRSKFFSYRVPGTMASGKADTSVSNSFMNGTKLDFLLQKFGFTISEYRMLVNGDDSLVVISRSLTKKRTQELQEFLIAQNKALGFRTKCKVRTEWHHVEYCSGLFWPTADGFVLGPKIGRRLPKLGFGLRELSPSEVTSMISGMTNDLAHLPVLSVYLDKCISLAQKLKIEKKNKKAYVDKEAQYKWTCSKKHQRSNATEEFFTARYGFSVDLCESSLRDALAPLQSLTECVHYPMMEIFKVDL